TAVLTARFSNQSSIFRSVWRPDGGPFFDRAGLLLQPLDEVERATRTLIAAQPLLGTLAADPSVRGLMDALSRMSAGAEADAGQVNELVQPLQKFAGALEAVVTGKPPTFSWRELISGHKPDRRELRRFILVQPVLDYRALEPGKLATDAIRNAAHDLGFDAHAGLRIRLTGPVP